MARHLRGGAAPPAYPRWREPPPSRGITDPTHWAVYLSEDTAYADRETGELIDGDDIDWHCRFNGSGEPDEGKRHPDSVTERVVFEPE